jgi:hypothetical protein
MPRNPSNYRRDMLLQERREAIEKEADNGHGGNGDSGNAVDGTHNGGRCK